MTDQDYINSYKESRIRVNRFANIAQDSKINLMLMPQPPLDVREPDHGDMMALARVEHKVRHFDFTCREDYPYPSVLIDEMYKVQNKQDKAFMYVIENKAGTHAAVVYSFTRKEWRTKDFYDWKRSRNTVSFHIDKSLVRFCKIEEVF